MCLLCPGTPVSYVSGPYSVAERKSPKRRRPCCLRPCASLRATCGARCWRGLARTRACGAQTIASPDPPSPARRRRNQKGGGAQQPHGPSLRSAWRASARRLRPRRRAERSDGPCGLRVFNPLLAAPAAGCLRGGMRAPARMLRELTRRVCPNGAPQARSELCGEPRKRPAPGLPRSDAQGSQTEGRLSFAYFSLAKCMDRAHG